MISDPGKSVALTFEQQEQLAVVETRLGNLEAEILIAEKNLRVIGKEVVKATKEREYQVELMAALSIDVEALKDSKNELVSEKIAEQEALDLIRSEAKDIRAQQKKALDLLARRRSEAEEAEVVVARNRDILQEEATRLAQDREQIEAAKKAFEAAVLSVSWS